MLMKVSMHLKAKNAKKIVAVHLLNDYSGSPKVLSQSIAAFKAADVDVELFTGGSAYEEGFLSGLVDKHHYFIYRRSNKKLLTLFSYLLSQVSLFFKLLRFRNDDVIIYVNTLLPFGAAIAGKLMGKKVVYHIHETSISPLLLKRFLRFVVQHTASKIIFVSESLKQAEPFKNIKQVVVFNAVPDSFYKKAIHVPYSYLDEEGMFHVLMVCSLKRYKGVDQFVEIARLCLEYEGIHFMLVLNANDSEVEQYFTSVNLPQNISIFSSQKDVAPFYQQASLLMNLSLVDECIETFGLTIIEAMVIPPKNN